MISPGLGLTVGQCWSRLLVNAQKIHPLHWLQHLQNIVILGYKWRKWQGEGMVFQHFYFQSFLKPKVPIISFFFLLRQMFSYHYLVKQKNVLKKSFAMAKVSLRSILFLSRFIVFSWSPKWSKLYEIILIFHSKIFNFNVFGNHDKLK